MSKKKILRHSTKKCDGIFETHYTEQNVPVLVCEECGHKIEDWVKWHSTYSNYWKDEEKWRSKKDHLMCLLGYFSHLYQEYYDATFTFSLNEKGLFRGPEIYQLRRMYGMLDSNPALAKKYMEWLFETKVKQRKRKITSLGFLATPSVITEFKLYLKRSRVLRRDTPLPPAMLEWISNNTPVLFEQVSLADHGDLHLLLTHYKNGLFNSRDINLFVQKLQSTGYLNEDCSIRCYEC